MSDIEKLRQAGNAFFGEGNFADAIVQYTKAIELLLSTLNETSRNQLIIRSQPVEERLLSSLSPLDSSSSKELCTNLVNRAQCYLKQSSFERAKCDCLVVLSLDRGNSKALFRICIAYEGLGDLMSALKYCQIGLQSDSKSAFVDLMRRLRSGVSSGSPSNGKSTEHTNKSYSVSECIEYFKKVVQNNEAIGDSATYHHYLSCLRNVTSASSSTVAFLLANGPYLLVSAALGPCSTFPNSLTPALNVLIGVAGILVEEFGNSLHSSWDSERVRQSLTLQDFVSQQENMIGGLCAPLSDTEGSEGPLVKLLRLSKNATNGELSSASAASRTGAALLTAANFLQRPQLEAGIQARLLRWKDLSAGTTSSLVVGIPCYESALRWWSSANTSSSYELAGKSVVLRLEAESKSSEKANENIKLNSSDRADRQRVGAYVQSFLQSSAQLCYLENTLEVLKSSGVMELAASCVACENAGVRQAASALLSRAFSVIRESHARGHAEYAKKKLLAFASSLFSASLDPLKGCFSYVEEGNGDQKMPDLEETRPSNVVGANTSSMMASEKTDTDIWTPNPIHGRTCGLFLPLLLVDRQVALQLSSARPELLPSVIIASGSGQLPLQVLSCEVLSLLSSDEEGRSVAAALAERTRTPDGFARARLDLARALERLSDSSFEGVRAAAAVAVTKLSVPSKGFGTEAAKAGRVQMMSGVVDLLQAAAGDADTDPRTAKPFLEQLQRCRSATQQGSTAQDCVHLTAAAHALEALTVMLTSTAAKAEFLAADGLRPLATICASVIAHAELLRDHVRSSARDEDLSFLQSNSRVVASAANARPAALAEAKRAPLRTLMLALANVLYLLSASRQREQEQKLREMGVDPAQWRQLQRLAQGHKDALTPSDVSSGISAESEESEDNKNLEGLPGGAVIENDPPAAVEARLRRLLGTSGDIFAMVSSLAMLARSSTEERPSGSRSTSSVNSPLELLRSDDPLKGSAAARLLEERAARTGASSVRLGLEHDGADPQGALIRESLSRFLLNTCEFKDFRGLLVQSGGVPVLVDLCDAPMGVDEGYFSRESTAEGSHNSNTSLGALSAAQALARVFISTNPTLLPHAAAATACAPLIRLARSAQTTLAEFEATLALANVASLPALRPVLQRHRVVPALEFLQFSSSRMVRRGATEALSNLCVEVETATTVIQSRLGLWLALARAFRPVGAPVDDGSADFLASSAKNTKGSDLGTSAAGKGAQGSKGAGVEVDLDEDDGTSDTPTAMAAAGGIAMALSCLLSDPSTPEGAKRAEDAALAAVRGGAVQALCELLFSGHAGLVHRACASLDTLSMTGVGVAALLTPLSKLDEELESASPSSAAVNSTSLLSMSPFLLLLLLAEGKNPAALSQQSQKLRRMRMEPIPAAAVEVAQDTIANVLQFTEKEVAAAVADFNNYSSARLLEESERKANRDARKALRARQRESQELNSATNQNTNANAEMKGAAATAARSSVVETSSKAGVASVITLGDDQEEVVDLGVPSSSVKPAAPKEESQEEKIDPIKDKLDLEDDTLDELVSDTTWKVTKLEPDFLDDELLIRARKFTG